MADLTVLSWNVRSLRSGRTAVADVIRSVSPDVAIIQEAPRFLRWRSKRAALARESGLLVGTADRVGGLMIMTSMRQWVTSASWRPLAKSPRRHQRALVTATVSLDGVSWSIVAAHLGTDTAERVTHATAIGTALKALEAPIVMGADINEEALGTAWQLVAADRLDACAELGPTFPAESPTRRIDAILVDPGLEIVESQRLFDAKTRLASDHLPLVVRLRQSP